MDFSRGRALPGRDAAAKTKIRTKQAKKETIRLLTWFIMTQKRKAPAEISLVVLGWPMLTDAEKERQGGGGRGSGGNFKLDSVAGNGGAKRGAGGGGAVEMDRR